MMSVAFRSFLVLAILGVALSPSAASAVDFRIVGSLYDSDDIDEAFGFGLGVMVPFTASKKWVFDASAYYFEDFENRFEDVEDETVFEVGTIPVDLGARWRRKGDDGGFTAGGGFTFLFMDVPNADVDDETGEFISLGYQARNGFWVDVMWRDLDIDIEDIEVPGFEDFEFELDMSGFQVNFGYNF